jgi:hypothetical protein
MIITTSYLNMPNTYGYYLFLVSRHFDEDIRFGKLFRTYLETSGKYLGAAGAIILPFEESATDISDELEAKFGKDLKRFFEKGPGLLITKKNFAEFDPRNKEDEYRYIYVDVNEEFTDEEIRSEVRRFGDALKRIVDIIKYPDLDFFILASQAAAELPEPLKPSKRDRCFLALTNAINVIAIVTNIIQIGHS